MSSETPPSQRRYRHPCQLSPPLLNIINHTRGFILQYSVSARPRQLRLSGFTDLVKKKLGYVSLKIHRRAKIMRLVVFHSGCTSSHTPGQSWTNVKNPLNTAYTILVNSFLGISQEGMDLRQTASSRLLRVVQYALACGNPTRQLERQVINT